MYERRSRRAHCLTIDVRYAHLERHTRGASLRGRRKRHVERALTTCVERVGPAGEHLVEVGSYFLPPVVALAEVIVLDARDLELPRGHGDLPRDPREWSACHRSTEQVSRLNRRAVAIAGESGCIFRVQLHEKLRRTILGHPIERVCDRPPFSLPLCLDLYAVLTDRGRCRKLERLIRRAERRRANGPLTNHTLLAIVEDPFDGIARLRDTQCAKGAVAEDGFGVNALAGTIDPALGEHGACEWDPLVAPRAVDVEAPWREVRVVAVDGRHRAVVT